MPNQSEELQKTDVQKAESRKLFIEKTAVDTISKTLSTLFAGGILGIISALIVALYGMPFWLYLPIGSVVFLAISLSLFLWSWRPTNKRLLAELSSLNEALENAKQFPSSEESDAEIRLRAKVKVLESDLETWKGKHANAMSAFEITPPNYITENNRLQGWYDKYEPVLKVLKIQTEKITNFVKIRDIRNSVHELHDAVAIKKIVFVLTVHNCSAFYVTLDESISGTLKFRYEPLTGDKLFESRPPIIKPGQTKDVRVIQRLRDTEADAIKKAFATPNADLDVEIAGLILTIKDTAEKASFEPTKLLVTQQRIKLEMI